MTRLTIRLFGSFQVTLDDEPVTGFATDKERALLAYLAVEARQPHRRERLAGLLWPESTEVAARSSLRRALSHLRHAVGSRSPPGEQAPDPPFLLVTRQTVWLNPESDTWTDVTAFDDLLDHAPSAEEIELAISLFRAPFLEGFSLRDSAEFEQWALLHSERLRRRAIDALDRSLGACEARGDVERALAYARRLLEIEPCWETAHQAAMRLLARSGKRDAALAQYDACCRLLAEDLGVEPAAETVRLYEQIRDGTLPAGPAFSPEPPPAAIPAFLTGRAAPARPPVFVAREREIAWLGRFLDEALAGQGRVVFVTGGAGRGKTVLLHEFARRALDAHPDLLVAMGTCNAYSGVGDPYLPFRGALAMLTGDAEGPWAEGCLTAAQARRMWDALPDVAPVLARWGSGLVGTLLPGSELLARARMATPGGTPWLDRLARLAHQDAPAHGLEQSHLFEQYANVLLDLSAQHPLLLVLDDLQWADVASVSLLFHVGRRLERGRILITGAYRPHELALGRDGQRHPLEPVLAELRARFGDVWLDLAAADEAEGRTFVDQFLDTEPNRLAEGFRAALFRRTGGHPLFTVELLRAMQQRGDLVLDEAGCWAEGKRLLWDALPARAEAAIAERIARLPEELRQMLTVASVEGEQFTAQAVAQVCGIDELRVLRLLRGELAGQHRLVREQGEARVDGRSLSRYRFAHFLFQQHLYQGLGEGERRLLHRRVGEALEQLYAARLEEVALQLAHHFAGDAERERRYARLAGERAAAQFANEEALCFLNRALDLTPEDEIAEHYAVLLIREKVHDVLGRREAQEQDLAALRSLAVALNDERRQAEVALRQASHANTTGDYPGGKALAQTAIGLAQGARDVLGEAEGHLRWGCLLLLEGDHQGSRTMLQKALAMARSAGLRQVEAESLVCLGNVSCFTFGSQGDIAEARLCCEQALCIYREAGDRRGEGQSLHRLADILALQGNRAEARDQYGQALRIARDIGDRGLESASLLDIGTILRYERNHVQAQACIKQALHITHETGDRRLEGAALMELGAVHLGRGDFAGAEASYEEALHIYIEIGYPLGEAWAAAQLGYALLHQGAYLEARTHCQRALLIRREVGNREGESGALARLGMISRNMGDLDGARVFFEQALDIMREIGDLPGESHVLCERALLSHQAGDDESTRDLCRQALLVIQDLGARDDPSLAHVRGFALTVLGHALAGLGFLAEASDVYSQALTLRRELGQPHLVAEPLAGLARVSLEQGDSAKAQAHAEEILDLLASRKLDGTAEPFRVYLTCYQVLVAAGDTRAAEILARGHTELQEWAVRIPDEEQRRSFLENVPWNRELVRAWQATQA